MPLKVFLCVLALLSLGACVPAEPDDDSMRTFDAEPPVMGRVQEAGVLRVGVPNDRPALADPDSGAGFVASLGAEVADSLGTDLEIVGAPNDSLIGLIDSGGLDLVFPAVSITEQRVRQDNDKHLFLDPYLVAHQRLLVRGDPLSSDGGAQALAGEPVCSFIDPETEIDISTIEPAIDVQNVSDPEKCSRLMARGDATAVTAADVILLGLTDFPCKKVDCDGEPARIVGDQISTFGYGPVIEGGASSWKDYVVNVLEEAQQEGRWEELYERYLAGLSGGEILEPPGMTVEEAAALFPKEL
ncbi:MAG: transporter substrate-binding domain-containing protein [Actinobacteria bacterium]|nr:transporter substrate-binding domain-containing protein [Actinomycetota bacterium]